MSEAKLYTALHPVRHDGKLHDRGTTLKNLTDKEALRLIEMGFVVPGGAAVVVIAGPTTSETLASITKLNKMSKAELVAYALEAHKLELNEADGKDVLVAALHERYVRSYVPAEAVEGDAAPVIV